MSRSSSWWFLALLVAIGLAACSQGRSAPAPASSAPVAAPVAPPPTYAPAPPTAVAPQRASPAVQAQIDRGVWLYGQRCAACHGAGGEGSASAPPVIGEGSLPLDPPPGARLRRVRFQSAMDLGLFIKDNMPPNGAHLPPQDVACVLAWLLQQHGRTPTEPISPATAGAIRR